MIKREIKIGAVVAILLMAAALRLYHIDFGLPALNDPDELMFQMGAIRMLRGGTLNPGWFGHPATTTMYLLALIDIVVFGVGFVTGRFAGPQDFANAVFADPTLIILPGRVAMAAFGVLSIWLTMRLASELFDEGAAIGAGLVLATCPLAVSWAQVIRSDIMATCFLLACLIATARYHNNQTRARFLWSAVWLAFAVATKWPFALGALAMIAALLEQFRQGKLPIHSVMERIAVFGALTCLFLLVLSPYLILAYETLLRNLQGEAQAHHLGATGGTPFENAWWYAQGPLLDGLGVLGSALALTGLVLVARQRTARNVVLVVLVAFLIMLTAQRLVWERWVLPLLPLLAIAAGAAVSWLWARLLTRRLAGASIVPIALLGAATVPLAAESLELDIARAHDTRQAATKWALKNIPHGSTVMIEQFSFDLQKAPWHILFPMGDAGCVDAKAMLAGKIDYATIEAARGSRAIVDYGTLAPSKARTCRADYAIVAQYDRYAAERDRFPHEFAMYAKLLHAAQQQFVFKPLYGDSKTGPVMRVLTF